MSDIRLLTIADVKAMRGLRLRGLKDHPDAFLDDFSEAAQWPLARYETWFGNGWIAGAFIAGELLGMSGLYREKGARIQHKGVVWGVYVAPEARGHQFAFQLISLLLEHASAAGLEQAMLSTNLASASTVALYQSLGFEPWGVEKRIMKLADGSYIDDVVMTKYLKPLDV